ncbi:choice-of-anchor L domain-containing protein [Ichthyenterobacterium magnum]|uniref:Gliding motility-associated-like protein n=1 Tax=Ichthyenterobacterium magnum TaxID=1230530 RepID=A0A420DEM7_9FLAO|nr:choice-of-anchor L domain-containing protein [Ichthyenterobacterium magnum]RKE90868.1 gliding motility-associated-like protein [Ichthyenterobacterium magnum]
MNRVLQILCCLISAVAVGQNIQVDSQTYTPQQLVEDILIDSDCIENVVVTNVVGGDFSGTDQSYGFFDATGTTFPFQSGIVLSTGRLNNVPGPNNSLSDDDAPNWAGDNELESVLNESDTFNATILEFDFTSVASQVSFRYIFASEEYQEGNANTCRFSDLFGFLIRPVTEQQYENIALIPGTQTPVKVTTVRPDIPNACTAENEFYFEGFNGSVSPTNFAGQTKVLTATANVVPNETYHVKLVIADHVNFRFDSAVFLEAGSFQLSTDLGPNLLVSTNNALCENDTRELNALQPGANNSYKWFRDGVELLTETNPTYEVTSAGTYNVEVTLDNNCISYGEVVIEYVLNPVAIDSVLIECDFNQDGITTYNLFDAQSNITNNDNSIFIANFFLTEVDAIQNINVIADATMFQNANPFQTVFARVENQNQCFTIAELQLQISTQTVTIPDLEACDGDIIDGFADFNLNDITIAIETQIPADAMVSFYETEIDALNGTNNLSVTHQNTTPNTQTIFVKVESNNQCYAIATVNLVVLYTPVLLDDEFKIYCLNTFPETITLFGGVQNDSPSNYYYEWQLNGTTTSVNTSFNDINEAGTYTVIVTDPNGCSSSRTITVEASNVATIDEVIVQEASINNTITVIASGEGFYEYAIDDGNGFYQEENIFTNVSPGFHTVYVRDRNGCGVTNQVVSVLGFPKFFTPNGDPYHERWQIYGVNSEFNQGIDIKIFNRFGKLLAQQNHLSNGWDGTLNGQPLPSDDYWFTVTLIDGRTYTGHFSLKR